MGMLIARRSFLSIAAIAFFANISAAHASTNQSVSVCMAPNQNSSGQSTTMTQCPGSIVYNTPVGTTPATNGLIFGGVRSDSGSASNLATTAIDAWGSCYYVNNFSGNSIFVPFASKSEWTHFISYANGSANVSLTNCARGTSLPVYPDGVSGDQLYCVNPTVVSVSPVVGTSVYNPGGSTIPTVTLPYARANSTSVSYGVTVTYSCGSGSTVSGETATATIVPLSSSHSVALQAVTNAYSSTADIVSYTSVTSPVTTTIVYATQNGTDSNMSYNDWEETVVYAPTTSGSCGSANGQSYVAAPSTNLCSSGNTASSVSGTGPWSWTCTNGTTVSCSASVTAVNGVCGTAAGTMDPSAPATNLCTAGTASSVTSAGGYWNWTCAGGNGGTSASCQATVGTNGVCGSSNGKNLTSIPTSNLCSSGTASAISGSSPWTWTCAGVGGGTSSSCSANYGNGGLTCSLVPPAAPSAPSGSPSTYTMANNTTYNLSSSAYAVFNGNNNTTVTINGGSYIVVKGTGLYAVTINPSSNAYIEVDGGVANLIVNGGSYMLLNLTNSTFNVFGNNTSTVVVNGSGNVTGPYTVTSPLNYAISYAKNVYINGSSIYNISDSNVPNGAIVQVCGNNNDIFFEDTSGTATYNSYGTGTWQDLLLGNSTVNISTGSQVTTLEASGSGNTLTISGSNNATYINSSSSTATVTGTGNYTLVNNSSSATSTGASQVLAVGNSSGTVSGTNSVVTYYDTSIGKSLGGTGSVAVNKSGTTYTGSTYPSGYAAPSGQKP